MSSVLEKKEHKDITETRMFPKVDFSLREITHIVIVRNRVSVGSDNKQFSIHCPNLSDIDLFLLIRDYVENHLIHKLESKVFFDNNRKVSSHSILLKCVNEKDFKFKSFKVDIPNYSSEEIKAELQKYLWGEKNE